MIMKEKNGKQIFMNMLRTRQHTRKIITNAKYESIELRILPL